MNSNGFNIEEASQNYKDKNKRNFVFFVLFIIFLLCYIYKCPAALDLGRYYEDAAHWSHETSLLDVLRFYYETEINFIYQTTLVLFDRSPLGAPFVTGIVVSTYYWFITKNYYKNEYVSRNKIFYLGLLGFPPFIYVLAIARTACAVVIFYFGVECFLNKKIKKSILFFAAALFTHVISGMFIGVFFLGIILNYIFSEKRVRLFNILCMILPPIAWLLSNEILPSIMGGSGLYNIFSNFYRFETYLGDNYTSFSMKSYALADQCMMYSYLLASYVLLNLSKIYSRNRCLLFTFFVALCFVSGSNFILEERYMIASSLFYAMYLVELLTFSGNGQCTLSNSKFGMLKLICILSSLSFFITLFLARRDFFNFL